MEKTYSLLLFGSQKEKYFTQSIQRLKTQELVCQKHFGNNIQFKMILVKNKTLNTSILTEIERQLTEDIILLNALFFPHNNWLFNMIKVFNEESTNWLIGDVISYNLFNQIFAQKSNYLSSNLSNFLNNCMIKKRFLKEIINCLSCVAHNKEKCFYERILREVESEMIYNETIKVFNKRLIFFPVG